ncbi:hypothetical protein E3P96_03428 [Wallemia ichthyophaga]|nr:hypothetical protein E3P96_03428 [Wallemia ichthyophaga]
MSNKFGLKRGITDVEIDQVISSATSSTETAAALLRNSPLNTPGAGVGASGRDGRTHLFVGNLPYRVRWQDLKDLFRKAGTVLRADVALGLDNRSKGYGNVLMGSEIDAAKAIDLYNGYVWQTRTLEVRPDRLPPEYDLPGPQSQPHNQSIRPAMAAIPPHLLHHWNQPLFNHVHAPGSVHPPHPGAPPRMLSDSITIDRSSNYSNIAQQFPDNNTSTAIEPLLNRGISAPSAHAMQVLGLSPPINLTPSSAPSHSSRTVFVCNLPYNLQWQELKDIFRAAGNVVRSDVAANQDGSSKGYAVLTFAVETEAIKAVQLFDGFEIAGRLLKVHLESTLTNSTSSRPPAPSSISSNAFSDSFNHSSAQSTPSSGLGIVPATAASSHGFSGGSNTSEVSKSSPFTTPLSPPAGAQPSPSYPLPRMAQNDYADAALAAAKKIDHLSLEDGFNKTEARSPKSVAHPGKISLPPATFSNNSFQPLSHQPPSRGAAAPPPMTPSMPGFYLGPFAAPTPGYVPEMMSPGIGPFSPGVVSSPSTHYNPYLNPAPGAPIYYGPSAPTGTPGASFNPMFPPVYNLTYPHYQQHVPHGLIDYHQAEFDQYGHQKRHESQVENEKEYELNGTAEKVNRQKDQTHEMDGYPFPIITHSSELTKQNNDSAVSSGSDTTTIPAKDADFSDEVFKERMHVLQRDRAYSHDAPLEGDAHSATIFKPKLLHHSKT